MEQIVSTDKIKKLPKCRLTERDISILKYIADNRFASPKILEERFWNGDAKDYHFAIVRKFRTMGFIESVEGDRGKVLGYRLTCKAVRHLSAGGYGLPQGKRKDVVFRTSYEHDEMLIRIRNRLSLDTSIQSFQSEAELRRGLAKKYGYEEKSEVGYKVPDALFVMTANNKLWRVALELELTEKSVKRYRTILRQLMTSPDWDIVLFAYSTGKVRKKIEDVLREVTVQDPRIRFAKRVAPVRFVSKDMLLAKGLVALYSEATTCSQVEEKSLSGTERIQSPAENAN